MKQSITITRKGQTTIPAEFRRKLDIDSSGGVLDIQFDDSKGALIISKPLSISELSQKISSYIKPSVKPLEDVDAFYQAERSGRLK